MNSHFLSIVTFVFFSTSFISAADASIENLKQKIRDADEWFAQADREGLSLINLTDELSIRSRNLSLAQDPEGLAQAQLEAYGTSFLATAVSSMYLARELAQSKIEIAQLKNTLRAAGAAPAPLSESKELILYQENQPRASVQSSIIAFRSPTLLMPPASYMQPRQSTPKRDRWCARLCGARFAHDKED